MASLDADVLLAQNCNRTRWSKFMQLLGKTCGPILTLSLVFGLACAMTGCDSGGNQSTQYKPIESNILKKLGSASQEQGEAAQGKLPARAKKK
jgi:hypothetical protein